VLRDAGLKVVEVDGWKTRGHGGMGAIQGILAHNTAGPYQSQTSSNYPSLRVVRDGRDGLPGPLAQLGIGFDGTWYVIAAGRCWHAGKVDSRKYNNTHALGIEAENPGDGSPWPKAQYDSYVRGVAALIDEWNGSIGVRGHKEAAIPHGRKIDPTFNMAQFRADVRAVDLTTPAGGDVAGGHTPRDWFDMASESDLRKIIREEAGHAVWDYQHETVDETAYRMLRDTQQIPYEVWAYKAGTMKESALWKLRSTNYRVVEATGERAGMLEAIRQMSGGEAIDLDAISKAAQDGAHKAVEDALGALEADVNLTIEGEEK